MKNRNLINRLKKLVNFFGLLPNKNNISVNKEHAS